MGLDPRYPIGLLLTVFGGMLAIDGLVSRSAVLGLNVNLYWGVFMAACGLIALYVARRKSAQVVADEVDDR